LRPGHQDPRALLPRPRIFYGDYGYYLDRLAREAEERSRAPAPHQPGRKAAKQTPAAGSESPKGSFSARTTGSGEKAAGGIRRLEREEAEILGRMEKLEAEKEALEAELGGRKSTRTESGARP
jgi:ATP-binding cassette subfamily F protein 3